MRVLGEEGRPEAELSGAVLEVDRATSCDTFEQERVRGTGGRMLLLNITFFLLFSIPFIIFALLLPLLPSRSSDPGSHSRLFPLYPLRFVPCIFIARRFQLFLPHVYIIFTVLTNLKQAVPKTGLGGALRWYCMFSVVY